MRSLRNIAVFLALCAVAHAQELGARFENGDVVFSVWSGAADRIEVWVYDQATGAKETMRVPLVRDAQGTWSARVPAPSGTVYYGYRAWGPNWTYDPSWTPGSDRGFVADVDGSGNRFNPNKLLVDPYAREVSHNPLTPSHADMSVYASGDKTRSIDSAPVAPKGVVLAGDATDVGVRPARALKDQVIYEVNVRGLTMSDPSVPQQYRGTYKGAAMKADYLKSLGVTAVEFLPVHEFQNQANDAAKHGANYWGYSTLSFFSPSRRYASDPSPGGPTREFKEMVRAFHDRGIKVYLDVVYNHTGEENVWKNDPTKASLLSWRGLDNAAYYELAKDPRYYFDSNGVGGNFNAANPAVRRQVVESLEYWSREMGVDGFRFDLAPVLGNAVSRDGFGFDKFDPQNILNRARRLNVDLIAEPWSVQSFNQGEFPAGWAEWNAKYRDAIRGSLNKMGEVAPGELATRIAGSSDLFEWNGRRPWHSVNFVTSHDGFTLRDVFSHNDKVNGQAWPFGPSDGGELNNRSWDHGGDPARQRQAARTGLAMLMLSSGVPMLLGGDEMGRTQRGNNNAYNLDSEATWLDWKNGDGTFREFTRRLIEFRRAHPALRPDNFFRGADYDGTGLKDIAWLTDKAVEADAKYMSDASKHFLAYRVDGRKFGDSARSLYVAYNGWHGPVEVTLPANVDGKKWFRVADTASWMEGEANFVERGTEQRLDGKTYTVAGRSALVLVESTEAELKSAARQPVLDRAGGRFVKRELAGAGQFAAAYLVKEAMKGRVAVADLAQPKFWLDLGAFSVAARAVEHLPLGSGLLRQAVPLAAGMAAVQLVSGHVSARDVLFGTAAYLAGGMIVGAIADGLIYPALFAAGPPGWIAAGAYTIGKLAVSLYLGEKLEHWLRGMFDRRSHAGVEREGTVQKIEAIDR